MPEGQENNIPSTNEVSSPSKKGVDKGGGRISRIPESHRGAGHINIGTQSREVDQSLIDAFTPKIDLDELPASDDEIEDESIIGYVNLPENQKIYDGNSSLMISANSARATIIEESEDEEGNIVLKAVRSKFAKDGSKKNIFFYLKPEKESPLYQSLQKQKDK